MYKLANVCNKCYFWTSSKVNHLVKQLCGTFSQTCKALHLKNKISDRWNCSLLDGGEACTHLRFSHLASGNNTNSLILYKNSRKLCPGHGDSHCLLEWEQLLHLPISSLTMKLVPHFCKLAEWVGSLRSKGAAFLLSSRVKSISALFFSVLLWFSSKKS